MRHIIRNLNLAGNPIFRRYAVAALRPVPLVVGVLVTQIMAAFSWIMTFIMMNLVHAAEDEVETLEEIWDLTRSDLITTTASAWIPILALQFLISYMGGTARVALGVVNETQTGMTDSLRLTPLAPIQKLLGQLFGMPLYTSVLSLLLIPWAILSVVIGDLSWGLFFRVYLLFMTGALMHHALGLTTATFIRQKVLAGTLSQFATVALHFILPTAGVIGIGVFGYLSFPGAVGAELAPILGWDGNMLFRPRIPFFHQSVSASGYHWTVTLLVLMFLLLASYRRWADADSQVFGKIGTLLFTIFILIFSCGELFPRFESSVRADYLMASILTESNSSAGEVIHRSGEPSHLNLESYASGFGVIVLVLSSILTPSRQARTRYRSLGKRLPFWDDARPAWCWIAAVALLAVGAWSYLAIGVSREVEGMSAPAPASIVRLTAAYLMIAFLGHAFLLVYCWKRFLLAVFLVGMVPLMISPIILLGAFMPRVSQAIISLSFFWLPLSAIGSGQGFFYFSLIWHLVILSLLLLKLRQARSNSRTMNEPVSVS